MYPLCGRVQLDDSQKKHLQYVVNLVCVFVEAWSNFNHTKVIVFKDLFLCVFFLQHLLQPDCCYSSPFYLRPYWGLLCLNKRRSHRTFDAGGFRWIRSCWLCEGERLVHLENSRCWSCPSNLPPKKNQFSCPPQKIGYIFLCFPRHGIVYKSMVFKSVHLFVRHVSHILPTSYALLWQFDACTALVYLAVFFWSSPWFLERHSFQTFLTIGTYRYRFLFRIDSYKAGYSFGAKWAQWVRGTLKFSWS